MADNSTFYSNIANIKDAETNIQDANKLMSSWSFFKSKHERYDNAQSLYKKAGNIFKTNKLWVNAIDAYTKALNINIELHDEIDERQTLLELAKLYRNVDIQQSLNYYTRVINKAIEANQSHLIGRLWSEIAELLENTADRDRMLQSINAYKKVAECYTMNNQPTSANEALIKATSVCIRLDMYIDALKNLEEIINTCVTAKTTSYFLKNHIISCVLCSVVCEGWVAAEDRLNKYRQLSSYFDSSSEDKFLKAAISAVSDKDRDFFDKGISLHQKENFVKIDNDTYKILNTIKHKCIDVRSMNNESPYKEVDVDSDDDDLT